MEESGSARRGKMIESEVKWPEGLPDTRELTTLDRRRLPKQSHIITPISREINPETQQLFNKP